MNASVARNNPPCEWVCVRGGGTWKHVQSHRGGGCELEKWMKKRFFWPQSLDPHQKVPVRTDASFRSQLSSSSGPTCLRRQAWFAAERKYQTCATQENGSPALQLDELGSDGRESLSKELTVSCFAFILAKWRNEKLPLRTYPEAETRRFTHGYSRLRVSAPPWNLCCKQESASLTQKHIVLRIRWPGAARKHRSGSRPWDSQSAEGHACGDRESPATWRYSTYDLLLLHL